MKKLIPIILIFLIAGCAHGLIGELPHLDDPNVAAELIILRNRNFAGSGVSMTVKIDGEDKVALRIGEYTHLKIVSGEHSMSMKCYSAWIPGIEVENWSFKYNFEPQVKYYFLMSPTFHCPKISPLREEIALQTILLKKYKEIPMIKGWKETSPSSNDSPYKTFD